MAETRRQKKMITCYVTRDQDEAIRRIHDATKVPMAVLIREGLDLMIERRQSNLDEEPDVPEDRNSV